MGHIRVFRNEAARKSVEDRIGLKFSSFMQDAPRQDFESLARQYGLPVPILFDLPQEVVTPRPTWPAPKHRRGRP